MEQTRFHTRMQTLGGAAFFVGAILFALNANAGSYFYGWLFWACMTFGCFALSLLHHMAKGSWGYPVLRLLEAGGGWKMLAVFGVLFVPVLFEPMKHALYPWTHAEERALPILQHKLGFYDFGFIPLTLFTFAAVIFFAYRNEVWLQKEDETGDERYRRWRTNWSSGFFPVFVLIVNFAMTMWVMSMRPEWFSTMYGIWFLVQMGLAGMSVVAIIVGTQAKTEPFNRVVTPELTKDIGNLMLTMTLLWAYFSFSQYLIIWSGNLPETISYWVERRSGGFENLGAILVGFGFFVPFLMLLSPSMKRDPKKLAIAGAVVLAIRFLDLHYNFYPMISATVAPRWADIGALLAFGGVWCVLYSVFVTKRPLFIKHQPQLKEATEHA
jgi:hypothetical protein